MKRVILVVLDSLGIGEMPDADQYGDKGADTFGHIASSCPDLMLPNLMRLGFGNIEGIFLGAKLEKEKASSPEGAYGRLSEMSKGKDTITGHWEIAGLYTSVPFKTFPEFPDDFMRAFEKRIGRGTLGNYAASGTEIIKELGSEHEATGSPIIYTSADSVFQIAANTQVIPLEELYKICETAREMLTGELQVGRVIARPFTEDRGVYTRTSDRKDYAVSPSGKTMLDLVADEGKTVLAIGKISDIFNGQGVTESIHTDSNMDGIDKTIEVLKRDFDGLVFTNLVDFDSKYGHRRDPLGYGRALEETDARLPEIMDAMGEEDMLILCADHGNDPVHTGWDHTREYVPLLVYGQKVKSGVNLGTRTSFADIGATVTEALGAGGTSIGESFYSLIKR